MKKKLLTFNDVLDLLHQGKELHEICEMCKVDITLSEEQQMQIEEITYNRNYPIGYYSFGEPPLPQSEKLRQVVEWTKIGSADTLNIYVRTK